VAGGYTWLKSVNYYDDKYRMIQSLSDNYKGGTDRVTNVYDFVGKVLKSKSTHTESDVTWKDQVTTILQGNMLINTSSSSSWVSGAASVQQLAAGQPGWLETIYTGGSVERVVGLSDVNTNAHFNTIDYGVYLGSTALTNTAIVYENGTAKYTIPGKLSPGDVVRIERAGTTITYKVNGLTKYTSLVASNTVLMADVSLNYSGCTVAGVRSSFSTTSHSTIRRFEYDHAGRLLKTWHQLDTQPEILLVKNEYNELGQLIDKKLHSTVASAADAKQSVDYRYNIRGWLTKLNESDLNINEGGDPRDFFGMELLYDQLDANISNAQLYNGNISAMKWSNQLGMGSVKENAYTYGYDPMNRISASTFKEKASSWSTPANSAFAETGFTYDLNGNIKTLQRNDKRASGWMDNLAYDYGTGSTQSNKLLKVTDTGDDFKGFLDGNPGTGTDYTYDANGNMITDLNKSISSAITYNFLNLSEKVTRNNGSVTYIYDASGRKLSQVASFATAQKQTDYVSEYVYENDALQFISHEEGRIMLQKTETIITADGSSLTPFTASANFTNSLQTINGETYIKVLPNVGITLSKLGTTPIGGNIPVTAGERYVFRVKGYSNSTKVANLYVKGNTSDIVWFGANLPTSSTSEMWVENSFTIPAGVTQITLGVLYSVAGPSVATDYFYINALELVKLTTTTPEYQYNLKDHLGNNRLTFTTKEEIINETATLESANAALEQSQFMRYAEARKVQSFLFDKTNGSSPTTTNGYAQRLSASANERYGLGKSVSVMPGDIIYTEVYAKYVDPVSTNWNTALTTIMSYVLAPGSAPPGTIVDGASYASSTATFPFTSAAVLNTANSSEPGPKAYLNWLVFDRDFNFILSESGYKRLSNAPKESGQDVAHELLYSPQITIKQAGYVYIYVSNEETSPLEVYFDDFKVTHTKSLVIQTDDYYAFGLTYNSYSRESSVPNRIKFQGQEHVDDLGLNWDSFKWRNHQPDIGRFFNVDPLAESYYYNSPFAFSENKVTSHVELEGLESESIKKLQRPASSPSYSSTVQRSGQNINVTTFNQSNDVYHTTNISLPSKNSQSEITDKSAKVIGEISTTANESQVSISRIKTTSTAQASAMFNNLEGSGKGQGLVNQRKLYNGNPGEKVIDTYVKGKGLQAIANQLGGTVTDGQVKGMMTNTIDQIGLPNVTNHANENPNLNTIDVAPSSIDGKNLPTFINTAKAYPGVRVIPPPKDPAVHLEIKQN
jgi:RHS repeat-associated protein